MLTTEFESTSYTHNIIVTPESGTIEIYKRNGKEHRDDGPASIVRSANGTVIEEYYRDGERHRDDGPAVIVTRQDGEVYESYYINGNFYGTEAPTAERMQEVEQRERTSRINTESDAELYSKSATEILHDKRLVEAKGQLLGLDLIHAFSLLGPTL